MGEGPHSLDQGLWGWGGAGESRKGKHHSWGASPLYLLAPSPTLMGSTNICWASALHQALTLALGHGEDKTAALVKLTLSSGRETAGE